jgi:hypothetical protein
VIGSKLATNELLRGTLEFAKYVGSKATKLLRIYEMISRSGSRIPSWLGFAEDVLQIPLDMQQDMQHAQSIGIDPDKADEYALIQRVLQLDSSGATSWCNVATGGGCSGATDSGVKALLNTPSRFESYSACVADPSCDLDRFTTWGTR